MAQVVGVGSECHRAEVSEAVARVRARSPEVDRMIRELEDARYECRVLRKTAGAAASDTQGDHVVIAWPGAAGRYADGSCIDPDANLVHEIHHCWVRSKNAGAEPCLSVPTRTASGALVVARASCEFDAVAFENRYRQAAGLCERTMYADFEVPGARRTCAAPEAECPQVTSCAPPARGPTVIGTGTTARPTR
jgi:hypothetical protein